MKLLTKTNSCPYYIEYEKVPSYIISYSRKHWLKINLLHFNLLCSTSSKQTFVYIQLGLK